MVNDGSIENNFEDRLANAREKDAAEKDAVDKKDAVEVADKEDSDKKDAAKAPDKNAPEEKSALRKIFGDTVENSLAKLKDLVAKARQSIVKKGDTERDKLSKDETNDLLEAHEEVTENMNETKDIGVVTPGPNLNKDTYVDLENPGKLSRSDAAKRVASTKAGIAVINPDKQKKIVKKTQEDRTDKKVASSELLKNWLMRNKTFAEGKENVLDKELKKGGDFKNTVEQNVATSDDQSTNVVAVKKEDKDASLGEGKDSRAA